MLANLLAAGFAGRVVPVNARGGTVQGLPAVPSILEIEGAVDLAVPAPDVQIVLGQCVARGVGGAVVISAGLVVDEPALTELEINPLVVSASVVIAVDARASLAAA